MSLTFVEFMWNQMLNRLIVIGYKTFVNGIFMLSRGNGVISFFINLNFILKLVFVSN